MKENGKFITLRQIREEIRLEQNYICADCGVYDPDLEIHHRVPKSQGGKNERVNLIGLCGPNRNDCHEKWDRLAKFKGMVCTLPRIRSCVK